MRPVETALEERSLSEIADPRLRVPSFVFHSLFGSGSASFVATYDEQKCNICKSALYL